MTDKEKVEVLEKENKLLKEQIELLKELKTKTKIEYVPYYPWWWSNTPSITTTTTPTITYTNTDEITTVTAPNYPTDTNYIYATGHTEFINNFNTTKTGDTE